MNVRGKVGPAMRMVAFGACMLLAGMAVAQDEAGAGADAEADTKEPAAGKREQANDPDEGELELDGLGGLLLLAGAVGTAAFGIVDGLKGGVFGKLRGETAGFAKAMTTLAPVKPLLVQAYGTDADKLLENLYAGGKDEEFARSVRQGARIGLTPANAGLVAEGLGVVNGKDLEEAVAESMKGAEISDASRNVLGRLDLALDARIEAALTLARQDYATTARISASVVSILIACGALYSLRMELDRRSVFTAVLVGLVAVPLAPVAKDLATSIQSVSRYLKGKM